MGSWQTMRDRPDEMVFSTHPAGPAVPERHAFLLSDHGNSQLWLTRAIECRPALECGKGDLVTTLARRSGGQITYRERGDHEPPYS
jgi:hypothetical protein